MLRDLPVKIEYRKAYRKWPVIMAGFVIVMLVAFLSSQDSNSTFQDEEASQNNLFQAQDLDIALETSPAFSPSATPTDDALSDLEIKNNSSDEFPYDIKFDNFNGDLCDNLKLKAYLGNDSAENFDGNLKDFSFAASETDSRKWKFKAILDDKESNWEEKDCNFDIQVNAWQKGAANPDEGYLDKEAISTKVSAGIWDTELEVVINEVMWMGSTASTADEWIELKNTTDSSIDIGGWKIENAGSSGGTITIPDGKSISANGYFLIANYNKTNSSSSLNIDADYVVNLSLNNNGNGDLVLKSDSGTIVDIAEGDTWPAGESGTEKQSMERKNTPGDGTDASNWKTCTDSECNDGTYWDTDNGYNYGTPGAENK